MYKQRKSWNKIENFIKQEDKDSEFDYSDSNYKDSGSIKIKINSGDNFPLFKPLFLSDMVILIRSVFMDDGTSYPNAFLEKVLYDEENSKFFVNLCVFYY